MKNLFIAIPVFCGFLALAACGDNKDNSVSVNDEKDSSSSVQSSSSKTSSKTSSSSIKNSSSSNALDQDSKDYKDTTAKGSDIHSGMGEATIISDKETDLGTGASYKTIKFGPYIWIAENVNHLNYGTCYESQKENCDKYGRLYTSKETEKLCPSKFHVPFEDDYKFMVEFAGNIESSKFGFNIQKGGSCLKNDTTLTCTNLGKAADLLTADNRYMHVKDGKSSFSDADSSGFYSLRCMKYSYFVENEKMLPPCNASTFKWLDDFYVASKGHNYRCNGEKWSRTGNSYCPSSEKGRRYYHNDTLFVCDGIWKPATMEDTDLACTDSIEWTLHDLNGIRYVCENKEWRLPTSLETAIGLCSPKTIGSIDTVFSKSDTIDYYCDKTGWRFTELTDYAGNCDSNSLNKIIKYQKATYICRKNGKWDTATQAECDLGACTQKRIGKIDTASTGVDYYCDTTGWRSTTVRDYYGPCDSSILYTTKLFKKYFYGCEKGPDWKPLEFPESDLGYCTPALKGKIKIDKDSTNYICDSTWRKATMNEVLGACTDAIEEESRMFGKTKYICANNTWIKPTAIEDSLGVCIKKRLKELGKFKGNEYVCTTEGWVKKTLIALHDYCTTDRENEIITYEDDSYVCHNKSWTKATGLDAKFGFCTDDRIEEIHKDGNYTYVCKNGKWKSTYGVEAEYGQCTAKKEGKRVMSSEHYLYDCLSGKWTYIELDKVIGKCTSAKAETIETVEGVKFYCSKHQIWREYTDFIEKSGDCWCGSIGTIVTYNGKNYGCAGSLRSCLVVEWYEFTELDELFGFCSGKGFRWREYQGKDYACGGNNSSWKDISTSNPEYVFGSCRLQDEPELNGVSFGIKGQHYYCGENLEDNNGNLYGWHPMTAMDTTGGVCRKEILGDTTTANSKSYYCSTNKKGKYEWLAADIETFFGKCTSAKEGVKGLYNGYSMQCINGSWQKDPDAYGSMTDSRDGSRYKTIKIGKFEWMAENLKYNVTGSWCAGNYNGCDTYGRLYNWQTAMNLPKDANTTLVSIEDSASYQGLCPKGWRLPLSTEWSTLQEECELSDLRKGLNGTDSIRSDACGFSSMPVGYINIFYRNGIDYTEELDMTVTGYWTATEKKDTTAVAVSLDSKSDPTFRNIEGKKKNGYLVRCIKNED